MLDAKTWVQRLATRSDRGIPLAKIIELSSRRCSVQKDSEKGQIVRAVLINSGKTEFIQVKLLLTKRYVCPRTPTSAVKEKL